MTERGIEWEQLGTGKEHLSVLNYKKQERQKEIKQADAQLEIKQKQLDSAEYTLSYMQDKVDAKTAEFNDLRDEVNNILKYIPDYEKSDKMEKKYDDIRLELDEQIKTTFTIMRNKDEIQKNIDALENITKKALDMQYKSEDTVYGLRLQCEKIANDRENAVCERNEYREKYERSERRNAELEDRISYFQDLLQLIEAMFPNVIAKAKEIFKVRKDREFAQEQQRIAGRKKRNRDISR